MATMHALSDPTQGAAQSRDNVKNTRALLWLVFRVCRYFSVPAAAGFSVPGDGKPRPVILLPSASISALPDLSVGGVLGSVQVAAFQDIPFVCNAFGAGNVGESALGRSARSAGFHP
jgi:hypothetical protein